MNLIGNPALLEQLAASYALGTLRGGARRRFEALARANLSVRTAGLLWQQRMVSLTELQPSQAPSDNVWKRIQISLAAQQQRAPVMAEAADAGLLAKLKQTLKLWRGAAIAGALCSAAAVLVGVNENAHNGQLRSELLAANTAAGNSGAQAEQLNQQVKQLQVQLQATPAITYVAVLTDDKAAASLLATYDIKSSKLVIKRLGAYTEAADKSLELWALPGPPVAGQAAAPVSLGVLDGQAVVRLTAEGSQVSQAPALAITLEPKGGVPRGTGPTGPVLFKGPLIQTAL
jgi:anti-sigma-K factor RskA